MINYRTFIKISAIIFFSNIRTVFCQTDDQMLLQFEKRIFASQSVSEKLKAFYDYSIFLKKNKDFEGSRSVLRDAYEYYRGNSCDSMVLKLMYEYQLSCYYFKDYESFSILYNKIRECQIKDEKVLAYSEFLNVWLMLDLNNWAEAKEASLKVFPENISRIDSIFAFIDHLKYKSRVKAKNLSVIPGVGQFYAGYHNEGAFSFLLNVSLGIALVFAITNEAYFLGGFSVFPVLFRSWMGGKVYAQKQVDIYNEKVNDQTREKLKKQLFPLFADSFKE